MEELVKECFRLQNQFNSYLDSKWLENRSLQDWCLALFMEIGELIDCYNWKWWAHKESNMKKADLEIADILHFLISLFIQVYDGDIDKAVKNFCYCLDHPTIESKVLDDIRQKDFRFTLFYVIDKLSCIITYISSPLVKEEDKVCLLFFTAHLLTLFKMLSSKQDSEYLFKLYILKNALNKLRQDYDYKNGNYKKKWGDKEDNEYLLELAESQDVTSFDQAYNLLKKIYEQLVLGGK
jgi:hypothetical protein